MPNSAPFPLESFLQILEARGIVVDTRARIRVQRIVEEFGKGFGMPAEDLGLYIAPIVAHTAEEQALIRELWAEYLAQPIQREAATQPQSVTTNTKKTNFKLLVYTGWAALISLVILWVYVAWMPLEIPDFEVRGYSDQARPMPGDSVSFQAHIQGDPSKFQLQWQLDSTTLPQTDTSIHLAFDSAGNHTLNFSLTATRMWRSVTRDTSIDFPIICRGMPNFYWMEPDSLPDSLTVALEVQSFADTVPDMRFEWDMGDSTQAEGRMVSHRYDSAGGYNITLRITDPRYPDCPQTLQTFHRAGEPPRPTQAVWPTWPAAEAQASYQRHIVWWWVICATLGLMGLASLMFEGLRFLRRRRHAQLVAAFKTDDEGPYHIPWPKGDNLIRWDETLDRVAALMAGRSTGSRLRLDLPGSVRATLDAGGLPALRFRGQTRPTAWLVLLDEEGLSTHERRLLSWLGERLHGESVLLDIYHYRGQPDRVWLPGCTQAYPMATLQTRHPEHRLLVVGRGQGLLHPLRAELHPRLRERLATWTHRTLLTPEHPAHWSSRERALAEHFGICPVDAKAMQAYLLLTELPEAHRFGHWRQQLLQLLPPPHTPAQWLKAPADLAGLQAACGGGFVGEWAAALHTYPELDYDLSLVMGAALLPDPGAGLRWESLWHLLRLPFMRTERQLRPLRQRAAEAPEAPHLQTARRATAAALEAAIATLASRGQRGMAHHKAQRALVLQRYALSPGGAKEQAAARALIAAGLANAATAELRGLPEEKSHALRSLLAWLTGAAAVAGIVVGIVAATLPPASSQAPPATFSDRLGMTQVTSAIRPDDLATRINAWGASYANASKLFDTQEFTTALDSANKALVEVNGRLQADSTDSLTLYTLTPYKALLMHAVGLCEYYRGNNDFARSALDILERLQPDFFETTATTLPHLRSLITQRRIRQGRVTDEKGQPLYGALLVLKPYDITLGMDSVYSDLEGNFTLSIQTSPVYDTPDSLIVSHPGHVTWRGIVTPSSQLEIKLKPGDCNTFVDLQYAFKTLDGRAARGARLSGPGTAPTLKQSSSPSIRLCGQGAGDQVRLSYAAEGYIQHDTLLRLPTPAADGRVRVVLPLWKEAAITLLSGKVQDATGAAVPQFDVRIGGLPVAVETDFASGEFKVAGPASLLERLGKRQVVTVSASGWGEASKELTLPALAETFVLRQSGGSNAPFGTWDIEVSHYFEKVSRPVPEFEVFVEGKSVGKGSNGKARIPLGNLPQKGGFELKLVAAGFEDYAPYIQGLETVDFKMSLHPEIQKLIDDMVFVQGGDFGMGGLGTDTPADAKGLRRVSVGNFRIGKFEVTRAQWVVLMGARLDQSSACSACPIETISWKETQTFIAQLNAISGSRFRLPTEAEWEYAAQGGRERQGSTYAGAQNVDLVAWYAKNAENKTHPVGRLQANELGLYDMSGNVAEWCADWYASDAYSTGGPKQFANPTGPAAGTERVLRGGSFYSTADHCAVIWRGHSLPDVRDRVVGFRLARD